MPQDQAATATETVRGPEGCSDALKAEPESARRVLGDRIEVSRVVFGRMGTRVGRALLVFSLAPENAAYLIGRRRILAASFALAASTAALLIIIARRQIVLPLRRITAAAKRMREGDRATRVDVGSRDEIGLLAETFNAMGEAVADREASLEAVTRSLRELFDHMREAICAFGPDGRVRGQASRQAGRVFGATDLEGRSVRELLFGTAGAESVDAQAFDEWISLAFALPIDQWPELEALAPKIAVLRRADGADLPLELEFRPVAKDSAVDRVMLLATDVSERRRLERVVQTKEADHARRIAAMRRLVAGGSQVFLGFIDAARERIQTCLAVVGPVPSPLRTRDIDELFRHIHTIRGEARSFDLPEVEGAATKLEGELDELRALVRRDSLPAEDTVHRSLVAHLSRISAAIDRGSDVFVAASPIGRAALEQVTVQRSALAALVDMAEGRDAELREVAARLVERPFGECTASLVDGAPMWAEEEDKLLVVVVEGREVGVPPALSRVLGAVLTHLVRNSVAHGVEHPEVREREGKPAAGEVRILARAGAAGPTITVEDDGAGLDVPAIEARATALGLSSSGDEAADLIFEPGVSTAGAEEAFAGRGVGLGAARSDLEAVGYAIDVETLRGRFTRFTIRPRG
jgi:HPt (histidine-containing phosphotransfer) domain-containing protein/HAMP domain-containing protein